MEIKAGSDKDVTKRDWLQKDIELTKGKNDASEALRIANEAVQNEDFKQKEQIIKDWNATIDVRLWMTEVKKASITQEAQRKALAELSETYSVLSGGQKYAENEVGKIEAEIKQIEVFISVEADKVSVYENAQTIVGHLNTINEGREAIKKSQTDIESENKKLTEELTPVFEKAKEDAKNAKDAFEQEEAEVKAKEDAVMALNLPEQRYKRDAAKELLGKITTAKERIETQKTAKFQHEATRKNLVEQKQALDEKIAKSAAMDAPIHDAKIKMDVRKEDLDKQSDTVNKFASTLRTKIQIGDNCPVCRQEIKSALPQEEELAALVGNLKNAYEIAEKEHKELVVAKVKLDAEIKTELKTYERDLKAFNEDKSVANAELKALDACKACGIEKLESPTLSALSTLEESISKTLGELNAKIKDGETQETEAKKLRKVLEAKRKNVETLAVKVSEAEKAMTKCKGRIITAEALVSSKKGEIENAM